MAKDIQAVKGMKDVLPDMIAVWQHVEAILRETAASFGYTEIRTPIVEVTELFTRSIGEVTDIVEKEMYTFLDRDNLSLSLRPEGTVGCVRACLEHGLIYNQVQRFWYSGAMFRHENTQRGRFRQFHQFGIEAFGLTSVLLDVELMLLMRMVFARLGILDKVTLELNSLGDSVSRGEHREALVKYFKQHFEELDADSKRRLETNPLRILDSKNPALQALNDAAPKLTDFLHAQDKEYFAKLLELLDQVGVKYKVNPRLVRGLDYYCSTVFEWVTKELGAQGAVCAGGHYDGLAAELGGKATPAAGFAIGLERLVELVKTTTTFVATNNPDAYLVMVGDKASQQGLLLAEKIRHSVPQLKLVVDTEGGNFTKQFKRADKSGASLALVLGEREAEANLVAVKNLRSAEEQREFTWDELVNFLLEYVTLK